MRYVVTSTGKPDYFEDRVSLGDVVNYDLDFTPWLEDKGTIVSTLWTVESGNASINTVDQSALISFNSEGKSLISCVVTTSTGEKKKVWLVIRAVNRASSDDYDLFS